MVEDNPVGVIEERINSIVVEERVKSNVVEEKPKDVEEEVVEVVEAVEVVKEERKDV